METKVCSRTGYRPGILGLVSDALPIVLCGFAQLEQRRHDHKRDFQVINTCTYGRYFDTLFRTDHKKTLLFYIHEHVQDIFS